MRTDLINARVKKRAAIDMENVPHVLNFIKVVSVSHFAKEKEVYLHFGNLIKTMLLNKSCAL